VRTHSRSHNSRLALATLGVLAALAAVAGDSQPATPADASVGDGGPAPAPAIDVRDIDFASLAQPGAACAQALDAPPPGLIALQQGASELLDERSFSRLELKGDVLYADLNGDGNDEAVVHAACTFGANGVQDTVQVWAVRGRLPLLVDTVTAPPDEVADDSAFPPSVVDVAVDGDTVEVTYSSYADDDPHCCPSGQAVVTYELAGGLEVVGEPETSSVED
jgi:hypothetical protein